MKPETWKRRYGESPEGREHHETYGALIVGRQVVEIAQAHGLDPERFAELVYDRARRVWAQKRPRELEESA